MKLSKEELRLVRKMRSIFGIFSLKNQAVVESLIVKGIVDEKTKRLTKFGKEMPLIEDESPVTMKELEKKHGKR